jgi:hypothetical protein
LTVVIAGAISVVPWLASEVPGRALAVVFGLLLAMVALAAALSLDLYPWSIVLVLGAAITGGIGLGRVMPARWRPWLTLLVLLSIIDLVQVALTSQTPLPGPQSAHGAVLGQYLNLRLLLPWGRDSIGAADLLLAAGIGEFWRRYGGRPWVAPLPAAIGLTLADLFVVATSTQGLALVPFLTVGWLFVLVARAKLSAREP